MKGFSLFIGAGSLYDNNVLSTVPENPEFEEFEVSGLVSVGGALWVELRDHNFVDPLVDLRWGADLSYIAYLEEDLKIANDQRVNFFGELFIKTEKKNDSGTSISLKPYIRQLSKGDQASVFGFGAKLAVTKYEWFFRPSLLLRTEQYRDDNPDAIKGIDPLTDEIAGRRDLSAKMLHYGLGFTPRKDARGLIRFSLYYLDHHKIAESNQDNKFTENSLFLELSRIQAPGRELFASIELKQRDYPTILAKSGSKFIVSTKMQWYLMPSVLIQPSLAYSSYQSDDEIYSYNKLVIQGDVALEF
jgi:hypothetical protein